MNKEDMTIVINTVAGKEDLWDKAEQLPGEIVVLQPSEKPESISVFDHLPERTEDEQAAVLLGLTKLLDPQFDKNQSAEQDTLLEEMKKLTDDFEG